MSCIIFETTIDGTDVLAIQSSSGNAIKVTKKGFFSVSDGIYDPPRDKGFHDIIAESDDFLVDQALMDEITKVSSGPFTDDDGHALFDRRGVALVVAFSGKTVSPAPLLDLSMADLLVRTTYKRHEKVINDSFEKDDLWDMFGEDATPTLTNSSPRKNLTDHNDILDTSSPENDEGDDLPLLFVQHPRPSWAESLMSFGDEEDLSDKEILFADDSAEVNCNENNFGNIPADYLPTILTDDEGNPYVDPKSSFVSSVDLLFPDFSHPEKQESTESSKEDFPSLPQQGHRFLQLTECEQKISSRDESASAQKRAVDTVHFKMSKKLLKDINYHFLTFCTSASCTVRFGKISGNEDMIIADIEFPSKRVNRQELLTLVHIITMHHLTLNGGTQFTMNVALDDNPVA